MKILNGDLHLKEKIALYGNLATSGGSVLLLVTALSVLGQHGDEFNMVRESINELRQKMTERDREMALKLAVIEKDLIQIEHRLEGVERMAIDPQARPDAWTASQDMLRTIKLQDEIKAWIRNNFQRKPEIETSR